MLGERIASQSEVIRSIVSGSGPCCGAPHSHAAVDKVFDEHRQEVQQLDLKTRNKPPQSAVKYIRDSLNCETHSKLRVFYQHTRHADGRVQPKGGLREV